MHVTSIYRKVTAKAQRAQRKNHECTLTFTAMCALLKCIVKLLQFVQNLSSQGAVMHWMRAAEWTGISTQTIMCACMRTSLMHV